MEDEKKDDREVWCGNCQCYVKIKDLVKWSGDDIRHYLCPGCDDDLLDPEFME